MSRPLDDILTDLDRAHRQTLELAKTWPMLRPALAVLQLQREAIAALAHRLKLGLVPPADDVTL